MHIRQLLVVIALILAGCQANPKKKEYLNPVKEQRETNNTDLWAKLINEHPDSLGQLYLPEAIKIEPSGKVLKETATIVSSLRRFEGIASVGTIEEVIANDDFMYEIGAFKTTQNETYKHLLIRDRKSNKRLLELIAASNTVSDPLTAIDQRRDEWVRLCNLHRVDSLINQLYMPDAIYYNHQPVIIGREKIAETYSYMRRDTYNLKLTPLVVEPVHERLVFEIGQCSGSYNGKYVIVWKATAEGWQIFLDSNI